MTDVAVTIAASTDRSRRSSLPDTPAHQDLFHALCADAIVAVHESGGDLYLVIPTDDPGARSFATELQETVLPAGESAPLVDVPANDGEPDPLAALRTLRDQSTAASVALLDGRTSMIERTQLDSAAMRLRRDAVAIGPTPTGAWYYLGTSLPSDAWPATIASQIDSLAETFEQPDRAVGVLPLLPRIRSEESVEGMRAVLSARQSSNATVAPYTSAWLENGEVQGTIDTS